VWGTRVRLTQWGSNSEQMGAFNRLRIFVLWQRVLYCVQEFPSLPVEDSQIRRKHAEQQSFDLMLVLGFSDLVPTKMVPRLSASLAATGVLNSPLNVTLSYVHGR